MSRLNGRLTNLERQLQPGAKLRIERRAGLVYLYWGELLVKVIKESLWDAI